MASHKIAKPVRKSVNKGAWTPEEDQRLAEYIEVHGAKKWRSIAAKAGLNRCEKSCRLRWLNYLRPNIKRGSFTDQEEDLIIRLHKLLGNRWSLIAGRLPGRTDNDIKNYWNSHLSKKIKQVKCSMSSMEGEPEQKIPTQRVEELESEITTGYGQVSEERSSQGSEDGSEASFNVDGFFNFPNEGTSSNMDWVSRFLDQDDDFLGFLGDGSVPYLGAFDEFSAFYA